MPESDSCRWPRLMRRETAAAYCDMTVEQFDRQVANVVPAKDQEWRGHRWDKHMLDAWADNLPNRRGTESHALDQPPANDGNANPPMTAEERRRLSLERA